MPAKIGPRLKTELAYTTCIPRILSTQKYRSCWTSSVRRVKKAKLHNVGCVCLLTLSNLASQDRDFGSKGPCFDKPCSLCLYTKHMRFRQDARLLMPKIKSTNWFSKSTIVFRIVSCYDGFTGTEAISALHNR